MALFALIIFLPARAQIQFSDSVRISFLTCTQGPDAYERFGHAGIRILDLRHMDVDVTFDYGVFSFNAPHFVYRFVKGETDYQLGAQYTSDFIERHRRRGLGMTEQVIRLDSAQSQTMIELLLSNYRPENRTYRYSYFFDNCSTRPYNLLNQVTNHTIFYDSAWTHSTTLREMVQEKTGRDNWLDFGIALAVAGRSDFEATYKEQMFLPDYLMKALDHAQVPIQVGNATWMTPVVESKSILLEMRTDIKEKIETPDAIMPNTVFGIMLLLALLISGIEFYVKHQQKSTQKKIVRIIANCFDSLILLFIGLTGCIVWFLNFFSLHPAVDHNINCLWLLPTHVIMAVFLWFKKFPKTCYLYFGITFAAIIIYVILDWASGQYCPKAFLLILSSLLLRSFMHLDISKKH